MSGIIPPSIVTYQYKVDRNFDKYVNAAFPFPVRIEQIWFTGDRSLLVDDGDWGVMNNGRGLKLAALKAKNPRKVNEWDAPSDWANFFGGVYSDGPVWNANEDLKPTMWMGVPEDHNEGNEETDGDTDEGGDGVTQWLGMPWYDAGFRSSAAGAPPYASENNPFWYNDQDGTRNYKTDLSIMLPDEILSMFIYDYTGDWDSYDGEGLATIHIAYTGVSADKTKDMAGAWGPWW